METDGKHSSKKRFVDAILFHIPDMALVKLIDS